MTEASYFLWLFGVLNLLNSGYLVASAVLNSGDWANVMAGLSPAWVWRSTLGLAGAAFYVACVRWAASELARKAPSRSADAANLDRLILPGYLVAGAVMIIASLFNPINPSLVLLSGVGASFGLNAGLLLIPGIVAHSPQSESPIPVTMSLSVFWFILALAVAGAFVALLGPGIRFSGNPVV